MLAWRDRAGFWVRSGYELMPYRFDVARYVMFRVPVPRHIDLDQPQDTAVLVLDGRGSCGPRTILEAS
jgi:hypothetical protein